MKKALPSTLTHSKTVFSFLFFMLVAGIVFGQNASISVQGVLTKSDGSAVDDGAYPITFRLWTAESGGTLAHEETIQQVETTGGVYSVLLGQNGFNAGATFNQVYYLGVSVNGGAELTPRPRLTHAPYTISVIGQNNKFTSTGPVEADGYQANGGIPNMGVAGKGYSFRNGGDAEGGLFSYQDNQVSLYTNATEQLKIANGLTELKTATTYANNLFATKLHTNQGIFYHSGNVASNTGINIAGNSLAVNISGENDPRISYYSDGKNYYTVPLGGEHIFTSGNVRINNNLNVSGRVRTHNLTGGGGFSFSHNNVADDDTGMFGQFDGEFSLYSNGNERMRFGANGDTYLYNTPGFGPANSNVARININSGLLFRETSSRRYKTNIRTFEDDFAKILQVRACLYNRFDGPSKDDDELGYLAEELDSLGMKHMVVYRADGLPEGVQYDKMSIYAIEFLKIQQATIVKLQADVAALQAEKSGLSAENTTLKNQQAQFSAQLEALSKRLNLIENAGATGMRK